MQGSSGSWEIQPVTLKRGERTILHGRRYVNKDFRRDWLRNLLKFRDFAHCDCPGPHAISSAHGRIAILVDNLSLRLAFEIVPE